MVLGIRVARRGERDKDGCMEVGGIFPSLSPAQQCSEGVHGSLL